MLQKPRKRDKFLFQKNELLVSISQGIIITLGVLLLYHYFMNHHSLALTRTIVFNTLIISNIFLTFTNRSFTESIFKTIKFKNSLAPFIIIISITFLALINFVPFLKNQFLLSNITAENFLFCFIIASVSVLWLEVYKALPKAI